jgi:2-(1,2-epoxy-1,2-dihydrophenyl)acetyl-CoA isomerase
MIYEHFHRLVRTLTEAPVPVIAAVNGAALGAGLDLAAICDIRLASSDATFASTWINVGLIPGMGGATWLTRLIGGTRAAQLVLTGQTIDAATAEQWNLVNDVVEPDQLLTRSLQVAAHLSSLPPIALARSKAALRRAVTGGVESELDIVGAVQGGLLTGAEAANHAAPVGHRSGETNHSTSSRNSMLSGSGIVADTAMPLTVSSDSRATESFHTLRHRVGLESKTEDFLKGARPKW